MLQQPIRSQLFFMSSLKTSGRSSTAGVESIPWLCSLPSENKLRHGLCQAAGRSEKGPHLCETLLEKLLCRLVGDPASQPEGSRLPTTGTCTRVLQAEPAGQELQARFSLLAIVGRRTGRAAGTGPALGSPNCDLRREGEQQAEHDRSRAAACKDRKVGCCSSNSPG